MTDAQLAALSGLVGALLGAGAGLLGTWHTLRHTRKLQAEEWERQTAEARLTALKDCYADYFASFQRLLAQVVEALALTYGKDKDDPASMQAGLALGSAWREHTPMMGSRLRLLEPNAEARKRSGDLLGEMSIALAKATLGEEGLMAQMKIITDVQAEVAKFEVWVIEERFGAPKMEKLPVLRNPSDG